MQTTIFNLIVDIIVILEGAYLSFAMALAGWIAGLKGGEAVTLVKTRDGNPRGMAAQMFLAAAAIIMTAVLFYSLWIPITGNLSEENKTICKGVGLVLFALGVLFTLWARQTLGRMWGISTSREEKFLPDHQLIDQGLYAIVRHPMYFGWCLAVLGLLLIYWTWIVFILFVSSLIVFYKRACREEDILAARFGEQWQAHVKRTNFFAPWIY
ncbi:MAG: isoprenylcysteine carboxylmethyltransferase family protein [Anaerolineales bacterium]|nr:isoprenylcysteine carboxylmethyltransferase family protein [Anaerolineales bacterium]